MELTTKMDEFRQLKDDAEMEANELNKENISVKKDIEILHSDI